MELALTQGWRGQGWMPLGSGGMKADPTTPQLQSSDLNPQRPDEVGEGGSSSCPF